ncbi:chromate efflux transporter [Amphibacillus xylanus]|uniref:Putative chromate transporter n=1 Tax=Amphibacillus xylanus (strain ATCC 51415 / DSM 6626 / JCM 7361 / LMG 17667 / NBRC 15112 / Ep01) TaxID=698758 RepID=K0IVB5_AMPXN|nr:chromate efflux transporter [Amphibacillus xylanus]BAM46374.1 putative chromate transporter [Amphibacillus xylanus NBRC 15112]
MNSKRDHQFKRWIEIFVVTLRLGLTSFGGPIAHLGYFHEEYVQRRKWLDEQSYLDLVALSQFLPGPASSQTGIGIGVMRGGIVGGIVAFLGFSLPSVIALMIFASLLTTFGLEDSVAIRGLQIVAVAVVSKAVLSMAKKSTTTLSTKLIALFALLITLLWQTAYAQIIAILLAGIIGLFLFKNNTQEKNLSSSNFPISHRMGYICLTLFFSLLVLLPILSRTFDLSWLTLFDSFYRSGSLVFGGGHVVLPLLEQEIVTAGWMSQQEFLTGFGATQAVPGPLFTFVAYIGTIINGWIGGFLSFLAIYLPAILLIIGVLPFWEVLRNKSQVKGALIGVNASVVGILISALYTPIWTNAVQTNVDFALVAILFSMLVFLKIPSWSAVIVGIIGGLILF